MAMINNYKDLPECCANCSPNVKAEITSFLNHISSENKCRYASSPLYYSIDYSENKYLFIDPLYEKILGYSHCFFLSRGPRFYAALWHPEDFKVFTEKIFPDTVSFVQKYKCSDPGSFCFSFNYRIKEKSGHYLSFLQRSTFLLTKENGYPLIEAGFVVDISSYKEDTKIVHTIEKISQGSVNTPEVSFYTYTHYPEKKYGLLSKKEVEILGSVYQGMTSKEIASKHCLSINTVNNHRKHMLQKTNTSNSSELIRFALKGNIL